MSEGKTTQPEKPTQPAPVPELTLVGRCFHIFDDADGYVQSQGVVRGSLGDGFYLIQYFEWIMGELSTLEIKHIDAMLRWQFYEDVEHMKFWHEYRAPKRPAPRSEAEEADVEQAHCNDEERLLTALMQNPHRPLAELAVACGFVLSNGEPAKMKVRRIAERLTCRWPGQAGARWRLLGVDEKGRRGGAIPRSNGRG